MQTIYNQNPKPGRSGMWADSGPSDATSVSVDANALHIVNTGTLVSRTGHRRGLNPTALDAVVDSFLLSTASPTVPLVLNNPGDFDGVLAPAAAGNMLVAAQVQLTLDNNADWDATEATLVGKDENGHPVTAVFSIPDTGNTTLVTDVFFSHIESLTVPAQSGVNGNFSLGAAAGARITAGLVSGLAYWDPTKEPPAAHSQGQVLAVGRMGRMWSQSETPVVDGDAVWARVRNVGVGQCMGALRTDDGGGDAAIVPGMRFITSAAAGEPVIVQVDSHR